MKYFHDLLYLKYFHNSQIFFFLFQIFCFFMKVRTVNGNI